MTFTRITVRPDQMGGVPCIRGLRIPVATIVDMVAYEAFGFTSTCRFSRVRRVWSRLWSFPV